MCATAPQALRVAYEGFAGEFENGATLNLVLEAVGATRGDLSPPTEGLRVHLPPALIGSHCWDLEGRTTDGV